MGVGLFVTATDTEAGKTFITAGLCRAFKNAGYKIGCCKPIATGETISSDALRLQEAALTDTPISAINPVILSHPIAPYNAALMESRDIDTAALVQHVRTIVDQHDISFIEGVGGVMVPLAPNYLLIDFMVELGLPVLIVSPAKLGTINHTLLTTTILKEKQLDTIGIILNLCMEDNIITESSVTALQQFSPVPIIAQIRYNKAYQKNYDFLAQSLEKKIDLKSLYDRLKK